MAYTGTKTSSQNGVMGFYEKYKPELTIAFILFIIWKARGFFGGLFSAGDAVGEGLAGATASIADAGKKAQQKVAIKTINPTATNNDLVVFEADAARLASFLGRMPSQLSNWLYPDRKNAFGTAKKYSRWMMEGSKGLTKNGVPVYRKASLQLAVLEPFYKDITKGRILSADLDSAMDLWNDDYQKIYRAFIR